MTRVRCDKGGCGLSQRYDNESIPTKSRGPSNFCIWVFVRFRVDVRLSLVGCRRHLIYAVEYPRLIINPSLPWGHITPARQPRALPRVRRAIEHFGRRKMGGRRNKPRWARVLECTDKGDLQ